MAERDAGRRSCPDAAAVGAAMAQRVRHAARNGVQLARRGGAIAVEDAAQAAHGLARSCARSGAPAAAMFGDLLVELLVALHDLAEREMLERAAATRARRDGAGRRGRARAGGAAPRRAPRHPPAARRGRRRRESMRSRRRRSRRRARRSPSPRPARWESPRPRPRAAPRCRSRGQSRNVIAWPEQADLPRGAGSPRAPRQHRVVRVEPLADQDEVQRSGRAPEQPERVDQVGRVLHRVIAPDHADDRGLGVDAELAAERCLRPDAA